MVCACCVHAVVYDLCAVCRICYDLCTIDLYMESAWFVCVVCMLLRMILCMACVGYVYGLCMMCMICVWFVYDVCIC